MGGPHLDRIHQHTANGGPPLDFINIQPQKGGSASRIHQPSTKNRGSPLGTISMDLAVPSTNLLSNDSTGLQLKYISMLSLVERFTKIPIFIKLSYNCKEYNGNNEALITKNRKKVIIIKIFVCCTYCSLCNSC